MRIVPRTYGLAAAGALALLIPAAPASAQRVIEGSLFSASIGSGARAYGMGGAFIAIADDATAASWNPAGLCVLEKPEASAVMQPWSRYATLYAAGLYEQRGTDGLVYTELNDPYDFAPESRAFDFASATFPFRIGSLKLVPQVSYQRVVDLGLDYAFSYRYKSTEAFPGQATVQYTGGFDGSADSTGGLDVLAGSLGVSFTPKLYLGVAVNRWTNGSDATGETSGSSTLPTTTANTRSVVEEFSGTSVNVGAIYKPTSKVSLGLVLKSPFTIRYKYTFNRTATFRGPTGSTNTTVENTVREGDIKWPRTVGGGVAVRATEALTFAADFTASRWSAADLNLNQITTLTRTVAGRAPTTTTTNTALKRLWPTYYDPAQPEQGLNLAQVDTQQMRFGAEYVLKNPGVAGLVVLPLRVGVFTDRQYFKDTATGEPVSLLGLTGGVGLVWRRVSLDFAYVHTRGAYKRSDFTNTQPTFVETNEELTDDLFRSHRFYVSSTVRF